MAPPPTANASGGAEGARCVVNDQMGAFIVLYSLLFLIGLPGSLLSAWVFVRRRGAEMRGSCGVYLLNLLASDLLLLLALPFKILKDAGAAPWSLMVFHCQASAVVLYISLYASVAFLALIVADLYLQDCGSPRCRRLQVAGFACLLSLVVWLLLLVIMVPNMALPMQQAQARRYLSCSSLKTDLGLHWHALTVFLNTALFLNAAAAVVVSSSLALRRLLRSRGDPERRASARRAVARVTALAAAFVLSFVPYHVVRTPYTLSQANVITDCGTRRRLFVGKEATLLLSVLHLCSDPLIFFYLCAPFRQEVRTVFSCSRNQEEEQEEQEEQEERGEEEKMEPVASSTVC